MRSILPLLFCLVVLPPAFADPDSNVAQLDLLVHLSPEQKSQAREIFQRQESATTVRPQGGPPAGNIGLATATELRAVLSPDQLKVYDRTPIDRGGGVMLSTPEQQLMSLDHEVGLTAAQRTVALQVFTEEYDSIVALPFAERNRQGQRFQDTAREQIHAVLTPEQLARQEANRAAMLAQWNDVSTATEQALRNSRGLIAKLGAIHYVQRRGGRSHLAGNAKVGEARFDVTGANGTASVVVLWERNPADAPVKVTDVVGANSVSYGL